MVVIHRQTLFIAEVTEISFGNTFANVDIYGHYELEKGTSRIVEAVIVLGRNISM